MQEPKQYPHYSNFIRREASGDFVFGPFDGTEREPDSPMHPKCDDEQLWDEWKERCAEQAVAWKLWATARHRRGVVSLIDDAVAARPDVDAALRDVDAAWSALDVAPSWPSAVKVLLDAHERADEAMRGWMRFAEELVRHDHRHWDIVHNTSVSWRSVAQEMGVTREIGGVPVGEWEVGSVCGRTGVYDGEPLEAVRRLIDKQRERLREVAEFSLSLV